MQGIQLFEYKSLQEYLQRIRQDELCTMPCEHTEQVAAYEEKLNEIYSNYQMAWEQVSVTIRQFEEHKLSIRRLLSQHKSCRKSLNERNILANKIQRP